MFIVLYNIAATGKEKLSIRKAAQRFGVPFQTLRDRVAGTVDPECIQMGRSPALSLEEEAKLVFPQPKKVHVIVSDLPAVTAGG
jgi:hypothetical protein